MSRRKKIERKLTAIMEGADGDRCSLCKRPFPENAATHGGISHGGAIAIVGDCCSKHVNNIAQGYRKAQTAG
jgi:hypothetical protein